MRKRSIWALIALATVVSGTAIAFNKWRTGGHAEMHAATERVAQALVCSDRAALAADPLLQHHPGTVDWLLERAPVLTDGYRVSVARNGANGFHLLPGSVTHLGTIKTTRGALILGFRYGRDTEQLEFVTASFGTFP